MVRYLRQLHEAARLGRLDLNGFQIPDLPLEARESEGERSVGRRRGGRERERRERERER